MRIIDYILGQRPQRRLHQRERKAQEATQELKNQIRLNSLASNYENVFSQVRVIVNEAKTILPYGVGRNGARLNLTQTPELKLLTTSPNSDMGVIEFLDLLFTTYLTECELDIRVWFDDKNKRNRKIIGFTVLPEYTRHYNDIEGYYWRYKEQDGREVELDRSEVMRLRYSRNPKSPNQGVSPAVAIHDYAQIDDLLAQFEKAFFENGAVPAYIAYITASTKQRFNDAAREYERGLKGAKNKNKTLYIWRQYQPETGETMDAVEIKQIQGNNSQLAIKDLASIINDRLNKAYGVSNFIMGDDASAKYDNAELSEYNFTKRVLYPLLTAFWNQFQFELDRITGGLGYALQFELNLPALTEQQKARAEINDKITDNIIKLIDSGVKSKNIIKALSLPDEWGGAVDNMWLENYRKRALSSTQQELNEKLNNITTLLKTSVKDAKNSHKHNHTDDALIDELNKDEKELLKQVLNISDAVLNEMGDGEILELIEKTALWVGHKQQKAVDGVFETVLGLALASSVKNDIKKEPRNIETVLGEEQWQILVGRTRNVLQGFTDFVKSEKEKVVRDLTLINNKIPSDDEIKEYLNSKGIIDNRGAVIARNELVGAENEARLDASEFIAKKYSINLVKVWKSNKDGATCDVCREMDGKVVAVSEPFDNVVELEDGTTGAFEFNEFNNNGEAPHAHANCRCWFDVELR